jgi:hypothetical protein
MRREDWWWVAVRVFALWLVVDGVRELPWLLATSPSQDEAAAPRWRELLSVLVPMGAGVLLFVEGHRLVPAPRAESGASAPPHLAAADLFWVCYKFAGLLATVAGADGACGFWLQGVNWKGSAGMLLLLAFGLLLLFSDALFRLAARGRVPRP